MHANTDASQYRSGTALSVSSLQAGAWNPSCVEVHDSNLLLLVMVTRESLQFGRMVPAGR